MNGAVLASGMVQLQLPNAGPTLTASHVVQLLQEEMNEVNCVQIELNLDTKCQKYLLVC